MNTAKNNSSLLNSKEMKALKKIGYIVLVMTILIYFVLVYQLCKAH